MLDVYCWIVDRHLGRSESDMTRAEETMRVCGWVRGNDRQGRKGGHTCLETLLYGPVRDVPLEDCRRAYLLCSVLFCGVCCSVVCGGDRGEYCHSLSSSGGSSGGGSSSSQQPVASRCPAGFKYRRRPRISLHLHLHPFLSLQ
jgi:hypothetical protein